MLFTKFNVSLCHFSNTVATPTRVLTSVEILALLESSSSSEDESSSGEEFDGFISLVDSNTGLAEEAIMPLLLTEEHPRQTDYLQVIARYSDRDFWRCFRVTRSTFNVLLQFLESVEFRQEVAFHGGNVLLETDEIVYITLQYLGNQGAMRTIADKFGRTESTICHVVANVCSVLFRYQSRFIKWPSVDDIPTVATTFEEKSGFPGIVGVIDGSHIKMHPDSKNAKAYRNYKKFHSIVLMGIVLPDKRFSYTFVGFPGSSHDSYVFKRSGLYGRLKSENCDGLIDSKKYHVIVQLLN